MEEELSEEEIIELLEVIQLRFFTLLFLIFLFEFATRILLF